MCIDVFTLYREHPNFSKFVVVKTLKKTSFPPSASPLVGREDGVFLDACFVRTSSWGGWPKVSGGSW